MSRAFFEGSTLLTATNNHSDRSLPRHGELGQVGMSNERSARVQQPEHAIAAPAGRTWACRTIWDPSAGVGMPGTSAGFMSRLTQGAFCLTIRYKANEK